MNYRLVFVAFMHALFTMFIVSLCYQWATFKNTEAGPWYVPEGQICDYCLGGNIQVLSDIESGK